MKLMTIVKQLILNIVFISSSIIRNQRANNHMCKMQKQYVYIKKSTGRFYKNE